MKEYEIWKAYEYNDMGQGSDATEPTLLGKEKGINFQVACIKWYLKRMLKSIEEQELTGYVQHQSMEWFYNREANGGAWEGGYYSTREEAETHINDYKQS